MRIAKWFALLLVAIMMTGCATKEKASVPEFDKAKFIEETNELIAMFKDVYYTGREFTAEEELAVKEYEENYKEQTDINVKLVALGTLQLYYEAVGLEGVEDNFANQLATIGRDMAELNTEK